jgi:hypothetical protein
LKTRSGAEQWSPGGEALEAGSWSEQAAVEPRKRSSATPEKRGDVSDGDTERRRGASNSREDKKSQKIGKTKAEMGWEFGAILLGLGGGGAPHLPHLNFSNFNKGHGPGWSCLSFITTLSYFGCSRVILIRFLKITSFIASCLYELSKCTVSITRYLIKISNNSQFTFD